MSSHFVKRSTCRFLLGLTLLTAPTLLVSQTPAPLRLNLDGPFVICEEKDSGTGQMYLRIVVPEVADHYNPGFRSDGDEGKELTARGAYQLQMQQISHPNPTKVPPNTTYATLDQWPGSCLSDTAISVMVSLRVPMPDEIWSLAPVDAQFTETVPQCDDSPADSSVPKPRRKHYATRLRLVYYSVDLSKVSVCFKGDCSFYNPTIALTSGFGEIAFEMAQQGEEPSGDMHYHAKEAHRAMRSVAILTQHPNHCVHFYYDGTDKVEYIKKLDMRNHGHTDCKASELLVCAQAGSAICQ
jgi:hypothetical protein